ncbi:hypothetical protein Gotri_020518 [Gossypium trilobum]|uniref:RNase H type-1 domain-containing protein n=1 Tax=Gossypium trilobum TaxID=34281 RepID=A0A7J9D9K5_9ROSI|nr:hypothetical protein [Gossypium trilobum]
MLVETILTGGAAESRLHELQNIHQLLRHNWKVHVRHISRSHNRVADHMAKISVASTSNMRIFDPAQFQC